MANQSASKPSLSRLIFILLGMGACLTVLVILLAIPLNAEKVAFCFDSFDFFGGDYEGLANCLDYVAYTSLTETPEVPSPVEPHVVIDGPFFSCDETDLMVSFEFDQPASGVFVLGWEAAPSGGNQSVSIRNSSVVSFLPEIPPLDGIYNIFHITLSDESGFIFEGDYENDEIQQFGVCSPQNGDDPPTPTSTPNPDGTPTIINSQCLNRQQLMIVFEFEQEVTGEYEVFVNGEFYTHEPVPAAPKRLFYFGAAPPGGGKPLILVLTQPDQAIAYQSTDYEVPQCDFSAPGNNGGDEYVPPPPDG